MSNCLCILFNYQCQLKTSFLLEENQVRKGSVKSKSTPLRALKILLLVLRLLNPSKLSIELSLDTQ